MLTVPMVNGRDQRVKMADVLIDNSNAWQVQHWRTLKSVYGRAPFFFHYEPLLQAFYQNTFTSLTEFNIQSLRWVKQQLGFRFEELFAAEYIKTYPETFIDLRARKMLPLPSATYYQVFADRIGFVPGMSILDLLFSEGPGAGVWLKNL